MRLGVNVDHVATIRQQRRGRVPDPVEAARICARVGATSIVCHLREDRRHIQDEDVRRLKTGVGTPLNLEMSMAERVVAVALDVRPAQVTLVPERRQELTTEGGLDVARLSRALKPLVARFRAAGISVSLFVDPVAEQLRAARDCGAAIIELHTGRYANAQGAAAHGRELAGLQQSVAAGKALGLSIAAGHGLDYENVGEVATIAGIEELNIGYSIIVRALTVGLEQAVGEMAALMNRSETSVTHATS